MCVPVSHWEKGRGWIPFCSPISPVQFGLNGWVSISSSGYSGESLRSSLSVYSSTLFLWRRPPFQGLEGWLSSLYFSFSFIIILQTKDWNCIIEVEGLWTGLLPKYKPFHLNIWDENVPSSVPYTWSHLFIRLHIDECQGRHPSLCLKRGYTFYTPSHLSKGVYKSVITKIYSHTRTQFSVPIKTRINHIICLDTDEGGLGVGVVARS